ncbi:predicted protein [Postia placenta Mad-698-R]|uniref:C2H2-type domain-containing protein n=1 Tax=Postia placenta MAD-698-R-SB12 TaxID=670580 RepID=A0A1X6N3M3_9APHY|nr:hypothetical protein POSPLADRAFT_1139504 [Postia placenta MAD-698-R-SB12]EED85905.1 predicted protein [Postia placenta Mad-698-R]OSX63208.1 hypothetical protein POSPLADRAFT_1139504 [Postia placenta MAD-698-R-SB12]
MVSDPFPEFCDKLKDMVSTNTDEWSFISSVPAETTEVDEPQNAEDSSNVPDLEAIVQETDWDLPPIEPQEIFSFESINSETNGMGTPLRSPEGISSHQEPAQEPEHFMGYPWLTHPASEPYLGLAYAHQPHYLDQSNTTTTSMYWYLMGLNHNPAPHMPYIAPYGVTSAYMSGLPYVGQNIFHTNYVNSGFGGITAPAADMPHPRSKKARTRFRQSHVIRKPRTWTPVARNYQCNNCHEWFSRSGVRDRHITTGCTKGKQKEWQCPICLKMYSRTDSRGRHCHSQHNMSYRDAVEWVKERMTSRDPSENEGSPAPPDDY